MRPSLDRRLAALEQRQEPPRFVVRYELDGVRYMGSPFDPAPRLAPPDEDLSAATVVLVRYTDDPPA